MRPKERIPMFMKNISLPKLEKRWDIDIPKSTQELINLGSPVTKYWNDNPDQRFGQVLINLGLMPDKINIWIDEENDILISQGCKLRDIILWGNNFNKEGKRLPETRWILIKDLDTDHIKAILDTQFLNLTTDYIKMFKNELRLREK